MWSNPTLFHQAESIEKNIEKKINIDTIEKSFLIDPLTANNAIYRESLILSCQQERDSW